MASPKCNCVFCPLLQMDASAQFWLTYLAPEQCRQCDVEEVHRRAKDILGTGDDCGSNSHVEHIDPR